MSQAFTAEFDDTDVPLSLTVNQQDVGGRTGLSPTVALRLGGTTDTFLDFSDNTFKTGGWTTKFAAMTEVERGHYVRLLDLTVLTGFSTGDTLIAEFAVNEPGVVGISSDIIIVPKANERIKDIFRMWGLDPAHPVTVLGTSRIAGTAITQTITAVPGGFRVTRT